MAFDFEKLTESIAATAACLNYMRRANGTALALTAAFGALGYLVRVNGLFVAAALGVAIVFADVVRPRPRTAGGSSSALASRLPFRGYAAALALFVVVATPSWLPRTIYAGNPVYHGYLSNYLWVDDYARAHLPGPPRYTLSTYAKEHTAGEAIDRLSKGMQRVFWETPRDKFGSAVAVALAIGIVVVVFLGDAPGILIACVGILQAMPLAWTAIANPARRLPAAALLPFAVIVIAAAANAILRRTQRSPPNEN